VNRSKYISGYQKPALEDIIAPGQVWRGKLCNVKYMLIRITKKISPQGWAVEEVGEDGKAIDSDVAFPRFMTEAYIKEIYVNDALMWDRYGKA
jgi:hypothetical protein